MHSILRSRVKWGRWQPTCRPAFPELVLYQTGRIIDGSADGHDERMRAVEELTAVSEPAWPQLEEELLANPEITVLPITTTAGRDSLYRLQVTTR
jgi:hypothetical protein